VSPEDKQAVKAAKGPSWKKVLLWVGVSLLILTAITVIAVMIWRKKDPAAATKEVIGQAKAASQRADIDAKIKVAEARGVEQDVVDELREIREIEDEKERLQRLADMF
jgi:hypothetical protein